MAEREEFGDCLNEIKENRKVSEQHTFVSKEVSERAHHGRQRNFQAMKVRWLIILVAICGK